MSFDVEAWADSHLRIVSRRPRDDGFDELKVICPLCSKPDMDVSAATGAYQCYRCQNQPGGKGGLAGLVALVEGISYPEAKTKVKNGETSFRAAGIDLLMAKALRKGRKPLKAASAIPLPRSFVPIYNHTEGLWSVPQYMVDREITRRIARIYGLGYCTEGRYEGRLIFPVRMKGRLRSFQARSMRGLMPKYTGPKVPKAGLLYGYDELYLGGHDYCVLVEGPTDVLRMRRYGFPAVGLMGKQASKAHCSALHRAGVNRVIVLLDSEASREAAKVARVMSTYLTARIAFLPEGLDPDSAPRDLVEEALAGSRAAQLSDSIDAGKLSKRH